MESREFDIIVFGATGYTGRYVIEELANCEEASDLKWAVAGRNVQKVKESLESVQEYVTKDITNTAIIKGDVQDPTSISDMCKRTRLILNCVGPYKLYGEVVVSACINYGTHHADLGAEVEYLETMQAKYFNAAREKGIYIVQSCGFDSIPIDYGMKVLKQKFPGDLNSVETFIEIGEGPEGRSTNIGTFLSVVHTVRDILRVEKYDNLLKEKVFKEKLIRSNFRLHKRFPVLFYSSEVKSWCLWFVGHNDRIVKRTQRFCYEYLNERPVQSNEYLQARSFTIALSYLLLAIVVFTMSLFSLGRNLLAKYPEFFTGGVFTSTGPTREQVLSGTTKFSLYGKGWKERLTEPTDQHLTEPNKQMKLTINGPEAAYVLTSTCMVQAGMVILQESNKLPLEGGVLTPGAAFQNTTLCERLQKRGITFEFENIK